MRKLALYFLLTMFALSTVVLCAQTAGGPVITIKRRCAPFIHSFIVDEWESINSTNTVSPKLY